MQRAILILFLLIGCFPSFALVRDSTLVLKTSKGNIYGTLTLPERKFSGTLAIIIAGSGPTDRNGNNLGLLNNTLKMLSDSLANYNIASLRFDKRGIGASKGAAKDESLLLFGDYVSDAAGWANKLSKDKRFTRIFLIGHSEGSLIGMLAAQRFKAAGLISIAGSGKPADELVLEQISSNSQFPKAVVDSTRYLFEQLRLHGKVSNVPPGIYQMLFRKSVQPFLASWIKYNPSREITKVKAPIMIIQGTNDLQVDTVQSALLAAANPKAELVLVPDMNHVFREVASKERMDNLNTYNDIELPVSSTMIRAIIRFIRTHS